MNRTIAAALLAGASLAIKLEQEQIDTAPVLAEVATTVDTLYQVATANTRCANYKIDGEWTRSWTSPGSLQACANECVAEAGDNCNMFSYSESGSEAGTCLYTVGGDGCRSENWADYNTYSPIAAPIVDPTPEPTVDDSRTYQVLMDGDRDFAGAQDACSAVGGALAVVKNQADHEAAKAAVLQANTELGRVWLGATKQDGGEGPSGFAWLDGTEWGFEKWDTNQPNNWGGNEDCMMLGHHSPDTWNDNRCDAEFPPLCSFEPTPVVIEPTVDYSHKYTLLMDAQRDWAGAQDACIADGGALAVISNQADHEAAQVALQLEGQNKAWLGGYRQETGAGPEGFAWTDGSEWTFGPWANGEPNDYGSGEDCLQMGYHSIDTWNDMGCSTNYYALCSYWTPVHDDSHDHDDHEEHHDSHDDEDEDHEEEHDHDEVYPETNEDGTPFNVNTPM